VKSVLLVNGVPASGKSSAARLIAKHFGFPVIALDSVKEPFFQELGIGDREYNRKLGRASYRAIWSIVQESPESVTYIIDAWFGFQPREVLQDYLSKAAVSRPIEIWCHAPGALIGERYRARVHERHPGHPGEDYIPELIALADRAKPLDIGACYDLDSSSPIDPKDLLRWVQEQLTPA
jgi:glucokinase